jgi:hypothetical protein
MRVRIAADECVEPGMSTKRDLIHDTPDSERGAGPVLDPDHDSEHDSDVNSGVNSGGLYVVLMLRADGAGWDDTYDTQHPDGLLRRRIWQLLASCVGTGRLYSTQRSTVVV